MTAGLSRAALQTLREQLAELCHEQWTGWMRHLFGKCASNDARGMLLPREWVDRWHRQVETPYAQLSTAEQDSDRHEADRFIALLTAPSSPEPSAGYVEAIEDAASHWFLQGGGCQFGQLPRGIESGDQLIAEILDVVRPAVKALEDRLQALTGYVQHKDECDGYIVVTRHGDGHHRYSVSKQPCSCGLASLLTPAPPGEPEKLT